MHIHRVEQNTPEWEKVRLGVPTASSFDKILTAGGKESTQAEAYANRLVAELWVGKPIKEFDGNGWTERGHQFEEESAAMYRMMRGAELEKVGFVTECEIDYRYGCSPDRLVKGNPLDGDGLLEMKNPAAHTHMAYLLDNAALVKEYHSQCQGQLYVTGRAWVDIMSYFPELPPVIVRVLPDNNYRFSLAAALKKFDDRVQSKKRKLIELGLCAPDHFTKHLRDEPGKILAAG